jgi:hypothetical protein
VVARTTLGIWRIGHSVRTTDKQSRARKLCSSTKMVNVQILRAAMFSYRCRTHSKITITIRTNCEDCCAGDAIEHSDYSTTLWTE